jgi:hypothetical protein
MKGRIATHQKGDTSAFRVYLALPRTARVVASLISMSSTHVLLPEVVVEIYQCRFELRECHTPRVGPTREATPDELT